MTSQDVGLGCGLQKHQTGLDAWLCCIRMLQPGSPAALYSKACALGSPPRSNGWGTSQFGAMQERVDAEKAPKQAASEDSDESDLTQHHAGAVAGPVRVQLQSSEEGLQVKLQVRLLF